MDRIGSRRHRLNEDESGPVYALVSERLQQLIMDHNVTQRQAQRNLSIGGKIGADLTNLGVSSAEERPVEPVHTDEDDLLYDEAGALFRLLHRMNTNRVGKPEYPTPFTWGTLEAYLGNGPYEKDIRHLGATCDGCEEDCDTCTRVAMTEEELASLWRLVEGPKPEEAES